MYILCSFEGVAERAATARSPYVSRETRGKTRETRDAIERSSAIETRARKFLARVKKPTDSLVRHGRTYMIDDSVCSGS